MCAGYEDNKEYTLFKIARISFFIYLGGSAVDYVIKMWSVGWDDNF